MGSAVCTFGDRLSAMLPQIRRLAYFVGCKLRHVVVPVHPWEKLLIKDTTGLVIHSNELRHWLCYL